MIISLSPLLYHHRLSDLHAGDVIRHTPSLDLSVVFVLSAQTNFSVCSDQVFCRARSNAQWSALISIPF